MSFLDELQKGTNKGARTLNGAVTNESTLSPTLDYFSLAGAMRNTPKEAGKLFARAYAADPLTAVRTLFYLRDIRGGQGERDVFYAGFWELATMHSHVAMKLLRFIPEYGRWDELLELTNPVNYPVVVKMIAEQFEKDEAAMAEGKPVSLMAKWLPSENTSSEKTRKQARALAKNLGLTGSQYRRKVVALRKYIKLLEQQMSAKQWGEIDYSKIPSQAGRKHVKAFKRHDEARYTEFLAKAEKGEVKMNTSTLYTYEVFDTIQHDTAAANAMWNNLPDYTNGTDALVLADVSGSMSGRPMSVSVSLALYFAERNKGIFNNKFMTFSERPQVVDVIGNNLEERLRYIENRDWGYNTNLEAAFDAILNAALKSGQGQDGMPKVLYVISDMEFDEACSNPSETIFENAENKFKANGLELPHVVFWNVNAHQVQAPATKFDNRVTLISGSSQSTFRYAVEGKSPVELMNEVVNGERYAQIVL